MEVRGMRSLFAPRTAGSKSMKLSVGSFMVGDVKQLHADVGLCGV